MNNDQMWFREGAQTFAYRVLYLRPSDYSDEKIAVGVVANGSKQLEAKFVSSVESIDLMLRLFGEDGVEQFHFAAAEIRRVLTQVSRLDEFETPSDLISVGAPVFATTADRNGLLTRALESASCLIRTSSARGREVFSSHTTVRLAKELCDSVGKFNPLLATRIFSQKHKLPSGETVDLPILGTRVFGAPVSFAGRAAGLTDQKTRAEAMVARFQVYRRHLSQRPKLYLLAPSEGEVRSRVIVEAHVSELREVAEVSRVELTISSSTDDLALSLIRDEDRAA